MAYTGIGHGTDRAVTLGLHGYLPNTIINEKIDEVIERVWAAKNVSIDTNQKASFFAEKDIIFDTRNSLKQNPNGLIFDLLDTSNKVLISHTYFSIGGGLFPHQKRLTRLNHPLKVSQALNTLFLLITQARC